MPRSGRFPSIRGDELGQLGRRDGPHQCAGDDFSRIVHSHARREPLNEAAVPGSGGLPEVHHVTEATDRASAQPRASTRRQPGKWTSRTTAQRTTAGGPAIAVAVTVTPAAERRAPTRSVRPEGLGPRPSSAMAIMKCAMASYRRTVAPASLPRAAASPSAINPTDPPPPPS